MPRRTKPTPGHPVRVTAWCYAGYTGTVIDRRYYALYTVRLTHDAAGRPLSQPFGHGLYTARELARL